MTGPKTILSLDLRGLAAFRVGLGGTVALDALLRLPDLTALYSNDGVLPVPAFVSSLARVSNWSLYFANGTAVWAAVLLTLQVLAGFCLMVGFRSRISTVVAWVLVASLHNRNPIVLNGGDFLLRLLLFWGIFLPLGARASVDAALTTAPQPPTSRVFGGPSIALVLQVCLIYPMTALLKSGPEWWPDGTASYYALNIDLFVTPFGVWLRQWPELLRWSTYAVYAAEAAGGFLLLSPFAFPVVRTVTVVGLMAMHLNFGLGLRIGLFAWIDMLALFVLLPSPVWDFLSRPVARVAASGLTLAPAPGSAAARRVALVVREALLMRAVPVVAREGGKSFFAVLDRHGQAHEGFLGLVLLLEHAPYGGGLARRLPLRRIAAALPRLPRPLARARADRIAAFLLPPRRPWSGRSSAVVHVFTLFCIAYAIAWNVKMLPNSGFEMSRAWRRVGWILRLDQRWDMFAPAPLKTDGWYIMEGRLAGGGLVDLTTGALGPARTEKPPVGSNWFPNVRWRKYVVDLRMKQNAGYLPLYGAYLCRSFDTRKSGGDPLREITITFQRELTMPPGIPPRLHRMELLKHPCHAAPAALPPLSADEDLTDRRRS